jgi:uncharacterized lipoprotein YddW (UPF0748 family)
MCSAAIDTRRSLHALLLGLLALFTLVAGCAAPSARRPDTLTDPRQAADVSRELRGLWVATVANIDWPSRKGLDVPALRAEMNAILDRAKALNLNAVFFQVRPAADAVYPSALEPWTEFLSGTQGVAPGGQSADAYDPLAEWIAGAHARGMQLHAWFNPYRARHPTERSPAAPSHVSNSALAPAVKRFDNLLWLDPGDAAALEHSLSVIADVVARYDVDGVHLDDYFYPYPKKGVEFDDAATYAAYRAAGGTLERDAWRRASVDAFVRGMRDRTRAIKPWVVVSVSPFGIWRPGHPEGVTGFDAWAGLHADAARWIDEGWIDLIIPQVYWRFSAKGQPHGALVEWWAQRAGAAPGRGPVMAAGLIPSRVAVAERNESSVIDTRAWPVHEIVNQVARSRTAPGVDGFVLFSARPLMENRQGLTDALREGVLADAALPPVMPVACAAAPPRAPGLTLASGTDARTIGVRLTPGARSHVHVLRLRYPGSWRTLVVGDVSGPVPIPAVAPSGGLLDVFAASVDRAGRLSGWTRARASAARPISSAP